MTRQFTITKNIKDTSEALWWKPIFSLQKEINRAFKETFSRFVQPPFMMPSFWDVEEDVLVASQRVCHRLFSDMFNNRQMFTPWCAGVNVEPYVDIIENGESFKIKADVPGLKAKDLDISISECAITIKGKKQEEEREKGDNYIRRECHAGEFSRTIALPEEANIEKAQAVFEDNVLNITIPKQEVKQKSRKIEVEEDIEKQSVVKLSSINAEEKDKQKEPTTTSGAKGKKTEKT